MAGTTFIQAIKGATPTVAGVTKLSDDSKSTASGTALSPKGFRDEANPVIHGTKDNVENMQDVSIVKGKIYKDSITGLNHYCILSGIAQAVITDTYFDLEPISLLYNQNVNYTCIVNATGTGAPHETVDGSLGVTVTLKQRIVLENPFGNNTPVIVIAEIFANNKWASTNWAYDSAKGYGVNAGSVQGEGIVIQTGSSRIMTTASDTSGGGHGATDYVNIAPCRVHVWRLAV